MKILLDENLPKKLKVDFGRDHDIFTVGEMGWNGKKNGELLGLMVFHGFEGFVTIDKNLQHQQNVSKFPLKIFILDALNNKIESLRPFIEKLKEILKKEVEVQIVVVTVD